MPMCAKSSSPGDSCGCVPLSLLCGKGTRVMSWLSNKVINKYATKNTHSGQNKHMQQLFAKCLAATGDHAPCLAGVCKRK